MTAVRWAVALALSAALGHASAQGGGCPPDVAPGSASEARCIAKEKPGTAARQERRRGRYAPPVEMERRQPPPAFPSRTDPGPPPASPAPTAPPPVTGCDPGGCWDSSGARYNAIGSGMMRGDGKLCQQVGNTMQCN